MPKLIDHEARRCELVDAAWNLIAAGGVESATVRRVAERAGVDPGSVRYIFRSQDDLLSAVADELSSRAAALADGRASHYPRPEQAANRLAAGLPLNTEQATLWHVERALSADAGRWAILSEGVGASRLARETECRHFVSVLADGLDVSDATLEFEVRRTVALMEGLSEQLCSFGSRLHAEDAHQILVVHLHGVQENWRLAHRTRRRV